MLGSVPQKQALNIQIDGEDDDEEQEQIAAVAAAETISNEIGIIGEILSTVPVKTLLKFRCVSKPWLSLISEPSFIKRYNTHGTRHGLFIVAEDQSVSKQYVLFAGHKGGAITHLLSLHNTGEFLGFDPIVRHVNGLFLFFHFFNVKERDFAHIFNPSTRNIFKLSGEDYDPRGKTRNWYFLGFDESSREHKVLNIQIIFAKSGSDFEVKESESKVFSLSSYSWRKIDVEFSLHRPSVQSVCVNNVMHILLHDTDKGRILRFNLQTEKFSVMDTPADAPYRSVLMIFNGLLGFCILENLELEVWVLKDYNNQVWVKGRASEPDITFSKQRLSPDVLCVTKRNRKKISWRSVEVNLSHEVLCPKTLYICGVGSYVECIVPLKNSPELLPLFHGKGGEKKCAKNS